MIKKFLAIVLAVVLLVSLPVAIFAAWATSSTVNNAISTATNDQKNPQLVADGSGGAIITWQDLRSGSNNDIYARRVDSAGNVQWTANGVAISTAATDQESPRLVSDGSGGAIITWQDPRNDSQDIYAQRVNAAGAVQWTANGIAISTAVNYQSNPHLVADGSGGAIITWQDRRNASNDDIYAQRVNASGTAQWTDNGTAISTAADDQRVPQLVSDGSGGAIITWQDRRSESGEFDIYAQRVNAAGAAQWTANGVAISTGTNDKQSPQLVADGSGGAIITWQDPRSGNNDIYAQRVNAAGAVQWTANGVAIATATNDQNTPRIIADGSAGAIITWYDNRSGTDNDIYAQRVNAAGAVQWTANGVAIATTANDQQFPQLVADGAAGAIITWQDYRSGSNHDIYAQRVNTAGTVQWTANGIAISTAANHQENPQLVADGAAGAIITWQDLRSGTTNDIYAQRILSTGILGDPSPDILVGVEIYPLNKLALLAPWLVLTAILALAIAGSLFVVRRHRAN